MAVTLGFVFRVDQVPPATSVVQAPPRRDELVLDVTPEPSLQAKSMSAQPVKEVLYVPVASSYTPHGKPEFNQLTGHYIDLFV